MGRFGGFGHGSDGSFWSGNCGTVAGWRGLQTTVQEIGTGTNEGSVKTKLDAWNVFGAVIPEAACPQARASSSLWSLDANEVTDEGGEDAMISKTEAKELNNGPLREGGFRHWWPDRSPRDGGRPRLAAVYCGQILTRWQAYAKDDAERLVDGRPVDARCPDAAE